MSAAERFLVQVQDMDRVRQEAREEGWEVGENPFEYVDRINSGIRRYKASDFDDGVSKARQLFKDDRVTDKPVLIRQTLETELDDGTPVPEEWIDTDIWYVSEDCVEEG